MASARIIGCSSSALRATQVSHAFFSHHHYDHIGDYPRLLLTRWDQAAGSVRELEVYGPPGLRLITQRLIADDGAFGLDLISRTQNQASLDVFRARGGRGRAGTTAAGRSTSSKAARSCGRADWTVTVAEVNHFAPHLTCFGYRLEADGQSFVYSGDTGPCRALATLAKDCDVLVHMCHYMTGTALARRLPHSRWDTWSSPSWRNRPTCAASCSRT